jgi:2-hydroxychromene-2-carboxylate isomerase
MAPAKGKWMFSDMSLCAKRYGVTLKMNPSFPINTLPLMYGATAVMNAIWQDKKDLSDPAVIAEALTQIGLDPAAFMAMIGDDEIKAALVKSTEEPESRGVFGAPTFFVGDQMFFGQDRMMFVKEALWNG